MITNNVFAVYDDNSYYIDASIFMISYNNEKLLKIIEAIFSSKVFNFMYRISGVGLGEKGLQLRKKYVNNLPLKFPKSNKTKNRIIKLVEDIEDNYKSMENYSKSEHLIMKSIKDTENDLDNIIYELYNLEEKEIKIIEEFLNKYT